MPKGKLQVADETLRLYAVVLTNLGMGPGKIASQCGHSFVEAIRKAQATNPHLVAAYHSEGLGTKVVLQANHELQLKAIAEQCQAAGIPHALVIDSGCKNFFDGAPTVTALGVGPAKKHEVKHILGRLQLLK